jgi:hypothetical protein
MRSVNGVIGPVNTACTAAASGNRAAEGQRMICIHEYISSLHGPGIFVDFLN